MEPKQTYGTKNRWNQKKSEKTYGTSSIGSIGNRWNQITLVSTDTKVLANCLEIPYIGMADY